jgi:hypothetical protein
MLAWGLLSFVCFFVRAAQKTFYSAWMVTNEGLTTFAELRLDDLSARRNDSSRNYHDRLISRQPKNGSDTWVSGFFSVEYALYSRVRYLALIVLCSNAAKRLFL